MTNPLSLFLTLSITAVPVSSLASYANSTNAVPVSDGVFDVTSNVGPESSLFWCGAATYLQARSVSGDQRIYVLSGPRNSTVRFGLIPPSGEARDSLSSSVAIVGNSLSLVEADQHCLNKNIKD